MPGPGSRRFSTIESTASAPTACAVSGPWRSMTSGGEVPGIDVAGHEGHGLDLRLGDGARDAHRAADLDLIEGDVAELGHDLSLVWCVTRFAAPS